MSSRYADLVFLIVATGALSLCGVIVWATVHEVRKIKQREYRR